jgi:collagenase-like PrtC family protease
MRFLLAGAFSRNVALIKFLSRYRGDAELVVYDGINKCRWNGGRINRDIQYTDGMIDYYYSKNVRIALTFTNYRINLDDKIGNELLEKFHKDGNCIILVNDELRQYIRDNFPKYKLIYSITGMGLLNIPLQDSDVEFYKDLESKYDWIVPRFEHIFDPRNVELDRTKWEVMVNDTCIWGCQYFDQHFKAIADENTKGNAYSKEVEECWIPKFNPNKPSKYNCMDIDEDHLAKLQDLGVRSFKITGREMTDEAYLVELERYVLNSNI